MKLQDYDLKRLGQPSVDAYEDIQQLANFGKYSFPIVNAIPAWSADNGEMAFYDGGTSSTLPGKRIYVRLSSSWEVFATAGNGVPAPPEGAVQFNSSNFLGGNSNFKWLLANSTLVIGVASTGPVTPLLLMNTNAASGVSRAVDLRFGFSTQTDGALIRVQKTNASDDGSFADDTYMSIGIKTDGALVECLYIGGSAGTTGVGVNWPNPSNALLEVNGGAVIGSAYAPGGGTSVSVNAAGLTVQNGIGIGVSSTFPVPVGFFGIIIRPSGINSTQAPLTLRGSEDHDIPAIIDLGDEEASNKGQVYLADAGNRRTSNYLRLAHANTTSGGFVLIYNANLTGGNSVDTEDPLLIVGGTDSGNVTGVQTLTVGTGLSIGKQRFTHFGAQSCKLVSGTTTVTSIGTLATVYIEGPTVIGSGIAITTGNYALWIAKGPVRIDGDLITGAATTQVKSEGVFFSTTTIGVSSNSTADNTLIRGIIGTTSLVANTLSEGRTIRLQAWGYYNTPIVPDTLVMRVKLGGTTVLTTGAQTPAGTVSTGGWSLNANIVCQTTGGAGTVFAQGDFPHFTGLTYVNWPMVNSSTTVINTTGANVVEITAQWGAATSASQIFMTQAVGELLN